MEQTAAGIAIESPGVEHAGVGRETLERLFKSHVLELARVAESSAEQSATDVARAAEIIGGSLRSGGKVLACGNGGSAADAQHFIAEFVGRYLVDRAPLPAISLSSDPSIVTALGNDYGYDEVFARQVRAFGESGDVLVALSTSGRSKNVIRAILAARDIGIHTIALSGTTADTAFVNADVWCRVGSEATPHIQEIHTAMLHSICAGAELFLESKVKSNA